MDRLAVNPFEDHRERRVGQDRAVRQHAEERDAEPFEALLEDRPRSGRAARLTLLTIAPPTCTPCRSNSAALSTISSIGRPTPPSETMIAGAPSMRATTAFESPITAPTPACPVPSMSTMSRSPAKPACAARMRAGRSSTTRPSM